MTRPGPSRAMTPRRLALVAALATLVAACSSTPPGSVAAPAVVQSPAQVPPPPTSASPAPANCGDPTLSSRPAGPLPPPMQMPSGSYMRVIQERGRLIAGVSPDTLKLGSVNPLTGQFEGFDIDMANAVARAIFGPTRPLSDIIEYRAVTNAQRIPDVQSGSVDLVAHTMTINCARRAMVDFSAVYYDAGQRVLVARDSKVRGIDELGGQKVCAPDKTTSLDNLAKAPSHPIPYPVVDVTDCLVAFQQGAVAAVSTDDTILAGMAAQDPYAQVVGNRFTDEPYGMAVNLSHPEFTQFINAVLEHLRADGEWTTSYNKWLISLGPGSQPVAKYKD